MPSTPKTARFTLVSAIALSTAALAGGKPVAVSNPQVEIREGLSDDGKVYPRLSVDVLVNKKPGKGMALTVKAVCLVGTKKMSDKGIAMAKWDEMDEGETKRVDLPAFVTNPLDATPASCDFTLKWGRMFGDSAAEVAKFCWTPQGVTEGACAKAK